MLKVIVECSIKIENITLNGDDTYHPCKKPNNEMKYIHADSSSSTICFKVGPKSIAIRLSSLYSSKEIIHEAAKLFE